jgi:hypothetical protein
MPSVLAGQTAQLFANNNLAGSVAVIQTNGTLNAAGDCVYAIVENVSAAVTDIGLFDADASVNTFVIRGTMNWTTRAFTIASGAGSVFAWRIAEVGPNGGPVYVLAVSGQGTAGHPRKVYLYPSGVVQNGNAVVVHHLQLESGVLFPSSPIVTSGAGVARSRDLFEVPIGFGMQDLTAYVRYVSRGNEGHDASARCLLTVGQVGAGTRWQLQQAAGASTVTSAIQDTGGWTMSGGLSLATASPGTLVELCATLDYSAGAQTAVTALTGAIGSGAAVSASASGARAVSSTFQGSQLALHGIPGTTSVDWAGTYLDVKIAAGLRTLDQMRQAF